ncbi:MAG: hypothetical protein AB1813_00800 [Verrucomicrobiota bacterium]|jgi:hypothetical protein
MKIHVDDWRFNSAENDILLLDVYLDNGQHSLLEVNPIRNPKIAGAQIPEMIVFCEMPGEKLTESTCPGRWISRPPDKTCPWSHVEVPPVLMQQIYERLGMVQPVSQTLS